MWGMAMQVAVPYREVADAFERARRRTDLSLDALAVLMGMKSHNQLLNQLHGKGHLSLYKLWLLASDADGARFLELFFQELSLIGGLRQWDGIVAGFARLTEAMTRGLLMARAGLPSTEKREEKRIA